MHERLKVPTRCLVLLFVRLRRKRRIRVNAESKQMGSLMLGEYDISFSFDGMKILVSKELFVL